MSWPPPHSPSPRLSSPPHRLPQSCPQCCSSSFRLATWCARVDSNAWHTGRVYARVIGTRVTAVHHVRIPLVAPGPERAALASLAASAQGRGHRGGTKPAVTRCQTHEDEFDVNQVRPLARPSPVLSYDPECAAHDLVVLRALWSFPRVRLALSQANKKNLPEPHSFVWPDQENGSQPTHTITHTLPSDFARYSLVVPRRAHCTTLYKRRDWGEFSSSSDLAVCVVVVSTTHSPLSAEKWLTPCFLHALPGRRHRRVTCALPTVSKTPVVAPAKRRPQSS